MIYILSGDIRSGKTTALLNWVEGRNDVDGLLCPDGENGKRFFLNIKSKQQFELEVESESEDTITIGSFHFLKSSFKRANEFLMLMLMAPAKMFLVIDELGKLELKNQGLHDPATLLIPKFINNTKQHLILVVRTSLYDETIQHYGIENHKRITVKDLAENSLA
ncbi:nucleoside-triphosphatase [uncultured Winogradskyella sp.]|uniref:nucleoside-triphosphatase n=1 Tax=uncultured Winogradskyella sp. TaxID=395353 RepID=UPI00262E9200|nr:nucleoside-triphosphatase [uncultured Winogradskyella sp.]